MGYLNFVPYWLAVFAAAPFFVAIIVPGNVRARVAMFWRSAGFAAVFAFATMGVGFASGKANFLPGLIAAVYAGPIAFLVATVFFVRAHEPKWTDWPAARLSRLERVLYAGLVVSAFAGVVLLPQSIVASGYLFGIHPSMSNGWAVALALLGVVAMDLLPSAPRAGLALGAVFYLVQVYDYVSYTSGVGWHFGANLLSYRMYFGSRTVSHSIDVVALAVALAHLWALARRRLRP